MDSWKHREKKMETDQRRAILISAIAQYAYCPRRCMLIHLEGEFEDNVYTLQGHRLHERADEPVVTCEDGVRVERALPLWSEKLGLQGKADTVEFHDNGTIRPVEYKRGSRRPQRPDDLQLCAQALCLEEMLDIKVAEGAIYYHESRRCRTVVFDEELREMTLCVIREIREMTDGRIPPPLNDRRCPNCSLIDACAPDALTVLRTLPADHLFTPAREEDLG